MYNIPTISVLLDLIKNNNIKTNLTGDVDWVSHLFKHSDITIADEKSIRKFNDTLSYVEIPEFVLIFKDKEPYYLLNCYEVFNSFIFEDVLVLPGRDSVLCYNMLTEHLENNHIR